MSIEIPELCQLVLRKIVGSELECYEISIQGTGTPGEGYVNDMIFLDLNKDGDILHLVLKMMPAVHGLNLESISRLYETEVNFYEKIWPALDTFQRTKNSILFDKIPKCFATAFKDRRIVIAMENIKADGFHLQPKKEAYNRNKVEFLFKQLAHFHAISFALKEHDPSHYNIIRDSLKFSWNDMKSSSFIQILLPRLTNLVTSYISESGEMKTKMQQLANRVLEEFDTLTVYKGGHGVVIHGDCWTNNLLFKFNESGDVEDVRFIDFQLAQVGTPVYDLSYCLYSGANKDILDDLEHFLLFYHKCLSSALVDMGCNPDRLYPYEVLKEEWKKYSKFGFLAGLMCWRGRTNEGVVDIKDTDSLRNAPNLLKYDVDLYSKVTTDLVRHMYHNGFL